MFARARAGKVEGVFQDAVDAAAGEDGLLDHRLVVGTGIEPAADLTILALIVLAHDDEVDILRATPGKR